MASSRLDTRHTTSKVCEKHRVAKPDVSRELCLDVVEKGWRFEVRLGEQRNEIPCHIGAESVRVCEPVHLCRFKRRREHQE